MLLYVYIQGDLLALVKYPTAASSTVHVQQPITPLTQLQADTHIQMGLTHIAQYANANIKFDIYINLLDKAQRFFNKR